MNFYSKVVFGTFATNDLSTCSEKSLREFLQDIFQKVFNRLFCYETDFFTSGIILVFVQKCEERRHAQAQTLQR